jgi:hypothetical protein
MTADLRERLKELAPKFLIEVTWTSQDNHPYVHLAGPGLSQPEPLTLPENEALFRLMAEICHVLTRWVSFNPLEPCEVTLTALSPERIERCAGAHRKHILQQERAAQKATVMQQAAAALSALKQTPIEPTSEGQPPPLGSGL